MTNPVTAFKSLAPNEYTITPFRAYAPHTYTYVSGSASNSVDVNVLFGRKYVTSSGLRIANTEQDLFDSVVQTFYSTIPYAQYGFTTSSYHPTGSVYVISVTQDIFGEQITPGTMKVSIGTSSSYDDGKGNMYISSSGTGSIIGSVFYEKGIALLKTTQSIAEGIVSNGVRIVSGTSVQVQFSSSVQLFEHAVKVKINPAEFNYSLYNPTTNKVMYTGSASVPRDLMASQSLLPYVTTIGLYNAENELVAVAKVSNPIQRTSDSIQTFTVRFDT